jgi:hypothetical protein
MADDKENREYAPREMITFEDHAEQEPRDLTGEARPPRHRKRAMTESGGIRFQRCGGGRRIIRKSRGE